jgi:ADP-heptose:LPS heptosyltransferase
MPMQKKNILVIKHGALGDIIFSLGAFKALRQHHKKDRLILLTSTLFKTFAEKTGCFDEIWIDARSSPSRKSRAAPTSLNCVSKSYNSFCKKTPFSRISALIDSFIDQVRS